MDQRNWIKLSRKLVDQYDMTFTQDGITRAMGQLSLAFFGEGVCITPTYPNPFTITLGGAAMDGTVNQGVAYDEDGQHIQSDDAAAPFTIEPADVSFDRWDLLVVRFKQTGDTPVPEPSDPISTVFLNLHDDYEILVRAGVASGSPAYPAKEPGDVILAGIQVPAAAAVGTDCTIDTSIRERCVGQQAPAGGIVTTQYNVVNGQAATPIAESFDGTLVTSVKYFYAIRRGTTVHSTGSFSFIYFNGTWVIVDGGEDQPAGADDPGLTITPNQVGTVGTLEVAIAADGFGNGVLTLEKLPSVPA